MDPATHQILIAADRLGEWEFPSDDKTDLWGVVDPLVPELAKLTGYELDVDRSVQDASFLTDVGLLDDRYYDRRTRSGMLHYIFAFRFSNFGRLFTLHGGEWEDRYQELGLAECIDLIESRGFTYVRAESLEAEYDGVNGRNHPITGTQLTWWIRFFDYI